MAIIGALLRSNRPNPTYLYMAFLYYSSRERLGGLFRSNRPNLTYLYIAFLYYGDKERLGGLIVYRYLIGYGQEGLVMLDYSILLPRGLCYNLYFFPPSFLLLYRLLFSRNISRLITLYSFRLYLYSLVGSRFLPLKMYW
jgi:hypothetical protein